MMEFKQGDRIRIDIPDETDPEHQFHGEHGEIGAIIENDMGKTGDQRDSRIYRIKLESDERANVRRHDIRPPLEGQ